MKNPHRQVQLKHEDIEMTVNLPDHPRLKVGNSLTLKDHPLGEIRWNILEVSDRMIEKSKLKTTWHNNI